MDQRMMNAACSGDEFLLQQLLRENPFILSDNSVLNPHENALTIAAKANQPAFARHVLKLRPELATEPNQDGLRALDIAAAYGNPEMVAEILRARPEVCRLAGRDGMTAVHYAARKGKVEIIDQLIESSSESAKDVTGFGETALHLAVKYYKFEAVGRILEWLEKVGMMEVVNLGDREGNTVLHYAVSRKQLACVELLLDWNKKAGNNTLQVNPVNKKGLTPMDIIDIFLESSNDIHLREILHRAGGQASAQVQVISDRPKPEPNTNQPINSHGEKPKNCEDIIKHFKFKWERDSPGEARQSLLIVAALIVTVAFQAGINPPTYLFDGSGGTNMTVSDNNGVQTRSHQPFRSVVSLSGFLVANSVALSTAVSIVDYLMVGMPFQRELRVSIFAMIFAYSWSLENTKPTGRVKSILLAVATSTPLFLRVLPHIMYKLRNRNRRTNA